VAAGFVALLAVVLLGSSCSSDEPNPRGGGAGVEPSLPPGTVGASDLFRPRLTYEPGSTYWEVFNEGLQFITLSQGPYSSSGRYIEVFRATQVYEPSRFTLTPAPENLVAWIRATDFTVKSAPQHQFDCFPGSDCVPIAPHSSTYPFQVFPQQHTRFMDLEIPDENLVVAVFAPEEEFREFLPVAKRLLDTFRFA
jgi:hypothetical protein